VTERLYADLAEWWPILSPPADYAEEAQVYLQLLGGRIDSLLELGSGGGHLASQMPSDLDITLVDRAPDMLTVSRALNPGRTHVQADFRDVRLDRTFDAVLLHDAVMYLTDRESLARAFATAAAHLEPGGRFLVLPDVVREDFEEVSVAGGGEEGDRAARMLEWHWDPDPTDDTYVVEFSYLLRDGRTVRSIHETHTMGLYSRATYERALVDAGLRLIEADPLLMAQCNCAFLAERPA
jgi:SAM-dependent methyltransferase